MRYPVVILALLASLATAHGQSIFDDPEPTADPAPPATIAPPPKPTAAQERQRVKLEKRAVAELGLIDRLQKAIDDGQHAQAYPVLVDLKKKAGQTPTPMVDALLARVALAEKRPDKAWAFVSTYGTRRDKFDPSLAPAHLAAADALLAASKPRDGQPLYDWIAANAEGRHLALAAEGVGQCLVQTKEYGRSVQCLEFAANVANTLREYGRETDYDWLRSRIGKELTDARRLRDVEMYGEDFVLYRQAETLRRTSKKYAEAISVYAEVIARFPEGPYADACKVYQALSLAAVKKIHDAQQILKSVVEDATGSLYQGEAILELGRITLEYRLDPDLAEPQFERLDEWIKACREQPQPTRASWEIPEKALLVTRPPQEERKVDDWGNSRRQSVIPGQLVNAKTCPWYLDELEARSAKYRGFLAFLKGDQKQALANYERLITLDKEVNRAQSVGDPNEFSRLKSGVTKGYLIAQPQELHLYPKRLKSVISVIDLYLCTERFSEAEDLCDRMLGNEFGTLSPAQSDYPRFAKGFALYHRKFREDDKTFERARTEFEKILKANNGTYTTGRAALAVYNSSYSSSDKAVYEKGLQALRLVAKSKDDNDVTKTARINLAKEYFRNGRPDLGRKLLNSFSKSDPRYFGVAQFILKEQEMLLTK